MKIRHQIFIFAIPLTILPLLLLGVFSYNSLKTGFDEQVLLQDQQYCLIAATRIEQILDECHRTLLFLAAQIANQYQLNEKQTLAELLAGKNNPVKQAAKDFALRYSPYLKIKFITPDGQENFATSGMQDFMNSGSVLSEPNFLKAVAISGGVPPNPIQFQATQNKIDDQKITTFTINLQFEQSLLGFIFIDLNLQAISNILERLSSNSENYYFLFDGSGAILAGSVSDNSQMEKLRLKIADVIKTTANRLSTSFEFSSFDDHKKHYFFSSQPVKEYIAFKEPVVEERWFIGFLRSESPLLTAFRQTQFIFLFLLILGLGIATVGTFYISRKITKPIDQLTEAAHHFSTGNLDSRISITSSDEIGMLANDFNKMAGDLQKLMREIDIHKNLSAIGQFAAGMYHDLKSPLEGIKLLASGMKNKVQKDDPSKKYVDEILLGVENLDNLIHETLDFVKPKSLRLQQIALNDFIRGIVKEIKSEKIRFNLQLSEDVQTIPLDPVQMKHVFINILNNAVDAISASGEIAISTSVELDKIKIDIRDTGTGIKQEELQQIFDPFFSTKQKGHGLGLSVSHQIIKNHGGEIEVKSELGIGTSVVVWLQKWNTNDTDLTD